MRLLSRKVIFDLFQVHRNQAVNYFARADVFMSAVLLEPLELRLAQIKRVIDLTYLLWRRRTLDFVTQAFKRVVRHSVPPISSTIFS